MSRLLCRLAPALALVTLTAALAPLAHARPYNPNRGRTHDPGHFFMRLSGGFGFSGAAFDDAAETTLSGAGGMLSFAFGATVARNIALNVDLFGLSMVEPNVEANGRDLGEADGTRATIGGIGIGATFYVMPANIYFAGSVGVGVGTLEFRGRVGNIIIEAEEDTEAGLALNFMVGKEWWVSRRWGLGLAAQAIVASLETDEGTGLTAFGIGLLFSASMN